MLVDHETMEERYFSKTSWTKSGLSYQDPAPHTFFQLAQGSCPKCKGLGVVAAPDLTKIIPDPK